MILNSSSEEGSESQHSQTGNEDTSRTVETGGLLEGKKYDISSSAVSVATLPLTPRVVDAMKHQVRKLSAMTGSPELDKNPTLRTRTSDHPRDTVASNSLQPNERQE